jgi:AraC-like DNA-binding protein
MQILSIPENILLFISGFGIMQGLLLSALVYFHPRSNRSVNIFLALFIGIISVIMAGPFVLSTCSWQSSFITQPLPLLVGPLLYLYVKSFWQPIDIRKALPHFIFFPVYIIVSYLWFIHLNKNYSSSTALPIETFYKPQAIILCSIPYLHLLLYYFFARSEFRKYKKSINQLFSDTAKMNIGWVTWLINGFLFVIVSSLVIYILMVKFPQHFTMLYFITMAIVTPYIYVTTYKGITQSTLWIIKQPDATNGGDAQQIPITPKGRTILIKHKSQKQETNNPKLDEIVQKIKTVMEEEKLYQEPELTLQHIADKLQFPTYQVSQAINDGLRKSFYDLINGYRVDEAKLLLLNPKNRNYTILSVGFEAGFNSKTTFNTVFKKFTGLTPTEYREQQKEMSLRA